MEFELGRWLWNSQKEKKKGGGGLLPLALTYGIVYFHNQGQEA
jgi:hypothetical protein